jgi:hypothetical protein
MVLAWGGYAASSSGYSMSIELSKPKGSAGEKLESYQPESTEYTPCDNDEVLDALTFELTYNAGTDDTDMRDVYIMFFNPNADGENQPRYYLVSRRELMQGGMVINPRWTVDNIDPSWDIYLRSEENLGGSTSENLIGSSVIVDGITMGTWQVIGIVADRSTVDFEDRFTWDAWDLVTVVLGMPWSGHEAYNTFCE